MILTKLLTTWALFHLITLSMGSDIFGAAQVSAPAIITTTPSSTDMKTTDSSTLTEPPNIATANPTALPTTTSTTVVGGYMLLILPPEPASYNTSNYTTSTTTMFLYSQPSGVPSASGVPNTTYPSPKQVKDLAEILFPSLLGGGVVVGGLSAWGIGWYLWKDFQRAMTDFPETNLDDVAAEFIEVAKAKSWQETVKREEQLERYRRMGQLESFLIKQEKKKRGTRFTRAQWTKFKEAVTPGDQTFDAPPPKNCVVLCPERGPHNPPPRDKNPNTKPGILKTAKPQTLTTPTQDPWKIFKTPTKTSDSKGKGKATARNTDTDYKSNRYSKTVDPDTLTTPTQKRTSKTPTKTSDSKGKGKATARDTDTDYKTNWYSKTVDPDTLTTPTQKRTLKLPTLTQTPPSSHTTPPPPSQTASSSHRPKPPRPLLTEVPHSPLPHRAHCRGFDWHDCCIYIADLQVKCFPY